MDTPTFDKDGYPTEETLNAIQNWPVTSGAIKDLMGFVEDSLSYHATFKREFDDKGTTITIASGGWSGNESVVRALNDNHVFHAYFWMSSHRGGKHVYRIPLA